MTTSPVLDFSALDLARMLVGVLSAAGGVAACLLFLVRIKRRDNSLLYFGLAALLYGVRLFINGSSQYMNKRWDTAALLITLVVGIPFALFVAETGVSRWSKIVWWSIGAVALLAAFGITRALLHLDLYPVQDCRLVAKIAAWCENSDKEQHDDLTLIVVDYKAA